MQGWRPPAAICLLAVAAFALLIAPLVLYEHPRMVDYPNHLARHHIDLVLAGDASPQRSFIDEIYEIDWRPLPNLIGDLLARGLSLFLPLEATGRVLSGLVVALWLVAPLLLYRTFWGAWSGWPLLSSLIIYNLAFSFGFENFLLAAPLASLAFALWAAQRDRKRPLWLLLFALLATMIYLSHAIAFGVLGLLVVTYESAALWRARTFSSRALLASALSLSLVFLPAILHFLTLTPRQLEQDSSTVFGGIELRLMSLASPFLAFNDGGLMLAGGATAVFFIALVFFAIARPSGFPGKAALAPGTGLMLLVFGLFAILVPAKLMGITLVHVRLPALFLMLGISAVRWSNVPKAWKGAFALGVACLLLGQTVARMNAWGEHDRDVRELRAALGRLDLGAPLLSVVDDRTSLPVRLSQVSAYAVIERGAFVPTLFTDNYIVSMKGRYAALDQRQSLPPLLTWVRSAYESGGNSATEALPNGGHWRHWWRDFSFVLLLGDRPPEPLSGLPLIALERGRFFTLYQVAGD